MQCVCACVCGVCVWPGTGGNDYKKNTKDPRNCRAQWGGGGGGGGGSCQLSSTFVSRHRDNQKQRSSSGRAEAALSNDKPFEMNRY